MKLLRFADAIGRFALCGSFALIIATKVRAIQMLLSQDLLSAKVIAAAGAEASVVAFLAVICIAVIVRLPPIRSVDGVEPYVTAIAGTFLIGLIAFLPPP